MSYQLQAGLPSSKVVYINSRDATTYRHIEDGVDLTSSFSYNFESQIVTASNIMTLVSVVGLSVPYSFYNIRKSINNKLEFVVSNAAGDPGTEVTKIVTLPEGNYTANTMAASLRTLIDIAVSEAGLAFVGTALSISYHRTSQKFTFGFFPTSTKDVRIRFLLDTGSTAAQSLLVELGLRKNDTTFVSIAADGTVASSNPSGLINTSTDPQLANYLLSLNCIDMLGSAHDVFVRSNLTTSSTLSSGLGGFSSILCRAPIAVNPGGVIFLTPRDSTHKAMVRMPVLKNVSFTLTDSRSRILNLHGLHWQIAIQLDFIYSQVRKQIVSNADIFKYRHHTERDAANAKNTVALLQQSQALASGKQARKPPVKQPVRLVGSKRIKKKPVSQPIKMIRQRSNNKVTKDKKQE